MGLRPDYDGFGPRPGVVVLGHQPTRVMLRAALELAVRELLKHSASASHVTPKATMDRLRHLSVRPPERA